MYPWCLKHRLWLTAIGNPIIIGGNVAPVDCLIFAKICAEESLDKPPGILDRYRARKMEAEPIHLDACIEAIRKHIGSEAWPKYWDSPSTEGGEPRHNGIPWPLGIVANLVRNGLTLEDALHLPEAQAAWLSTAMAIQKGAKLEVLTTDDEALLDTLSTVERPK
jgi:hypothetical protein